MDRREYLAAAGTAAAGVLGYAGARLFDIRPYDPELPAGETPGERIVAASDYCGVADHRAITRVRVTRDSVGPDGYHLGRSCARHEHSRRRHLYVHTTDRLPPLPAPYPYLPYIALYHWETVTRRGAPKGAVFHLTDGIGVRDKNHEPVDDITATPKLSDGAWIFGGFDRAAQLPPYLSPYETTWRPIETDGSGAAYEISSLDDYAKVVPRRETVDRLVPGCRVRVSLDEAGRLARIVDDHVVVADPAKVFGYRGDESDLVVDEPRTIGYRRVTEFDNYGTATAPRPPGDVEGDHRTRVGLLLRDLLTY